MEILYPNSFAKLFSTMLLVFQLFSDLNHNKDFNRESVSSIVWFQKSAEAKALYLQGYNVAITRLIEIRNIKPLEKNLAVVLDIDETILDNSPFQAKLAYSFQNYNNNLWSKWTSEKNADLLPGVARFFTVADSLGFTIFLVSNRYEYEKEVTLENLQRFKLPGLNVNNIFLREFESSKKDRRDIIGSNYSIELLLGDNLGDFDDVFDTKSLEEREMNVVKNANKFGSKFIIFPNPMYGTWDDLLYKDTESSRSSQTKSLIRKEVLKRSK